MDSTNNRTFAQTFKFSDIKLSKYCLNVLNTNLKYLYFDGLDVVAEFTPEYIRWLLTVLPEPHREYVITKLLTAEKFDALIDVLSLRPYVSIIFKMPFDALHKLGKIVGIKKIEELFWFESDLDKCMSSFKNMCTQLNF
jgi:hypothetical protein